MGTPDLSPDQRPKRARSCSGHEEGVGDPVAGRQINADLAGYHIAAHADVADVETAFVPDYEPGDPSGIKGVGEIGTVGTVAAITNVVWHATGTRQRTLPLASRPTWTRFRYRLPPTKPAAGAEIDRHGREICAARW
jgi:hypothetical protein